MQLNNYQITYILELLNMLSSFLWMKRLDLDRHITYVIKIHPVNFSICLAHLFGCRHILDVFSYLDPVSCKICLPQFIWMQTCSTLSLP